MSGKRHTEELKIAAVKQVAQRGLSALRMRGRDVRLALQAPLFRK